MEDSIDELNYKKLKSKYKINKKIKFTILLLVKLSPLPSPNTHSWIASKRLLIHHPYFTISHHRHSVHPNQTRPLTHHIHGLSLKSTCSTHHLDPSLLPPRGVIIPMWLLATLQSPHCSFSFPRPKLPSHNINIPSPIYIIIIHRNKHHHGTIRLNQAMIIVIINMHRDVAHYKQSVLRHFQILSH